MKAIVCTKYGPPEVLEFKELEKLSPSNNEILVKVHATSVTVADVRVRGFRVPLYFWLQARMFLGLRRPKKAILGAELAGEVESVGKNVTRFKVGDQVFAATAPDFGCYAEYRCLPEGGIVVTKPSNLTYEEAATIPTGGLTALHFLRKGGIKKGQKVLIYGASGSVGTFAVQLAARHFGAEVAAVCSTSNLDLVRSLGAAKAVDYTKEDFTRTNERYDIVFDAVGKVSSSRCKKVLTPNGKYVSVMDSRITKHVEDLELLKELAESGELRPVVDGCYPWERIAEAHRYVDQGHKRGNVAITVRHEDGRPVSGD